jgi:8-oxo-dGTP diphosphatase
MKDFCLAFVFDEDDDVILIRKNRPEVLSGKWNGIGGHLEEGENKFEGCHREVFEETGVLVKARWFQCFGLFTVPNFGLIHLFVTKIHGRIHPSQKTDEEVCMMTVEEAVNAPDIVPNLKWMIPMAISHLDGSDPCRFYSITEQARFDG